MSGNSHTGSNSNPPPPLASENLGALAISANQQRQPLQNPVSLVANRSPFSVDRFFNGMHSFQSAAELQYYFERVAGPGARVAITDTFYGPCGTRSGSNGMNTPLALPQPSSPASPGNQINGLSQRENQFPPLGQITSPVGSQSTSSDENDYEYERIGILFICELHPSTGDAVENRRLTSHRLVRPVPCAICGRFG